MQKNSKFKNLKVDTNLGGESDRIERLEKNTTLDTATTLNTVRDSPFKKGSTMTPLEYKEIKSFKDDKRAMIANAER